LQQAANPLRRDRDVDHVYIGKLVEFVEFVEEFDVARLDVQGTDYPGQ
jgi:hypothetical protein